MRIAALLPCLLLTGCFAAGLKSEPDFPSQPKAEASAAAAPAVAAGSTVAAGPTVAAAPAARPSGMRGGGSAASGGASTAAARAPAPTSRSADPDEPPVAPVEGRDPLTQARADCWMKVEHEKIRDIDRRSAFVDKCVNAAMKGGGADPEPTAAPRRRAPR